LTAWGGYDLGESEMKERMKYMIDQIEPMLADIEKHLSLTNDILKREPPVKFPGSFPASVTTATVTANGIIL
jgi:hypothetical protein